MKMLAESYGCVLSPAFLVSPVDGGGETVSKWAILTFIQ